MFNTRLFLQNHAACCEWGQLPDAVKRLFPRPTGTLALAKIYPADPDHRLYCFEFHQAGDPEPRTHEADIVVIHESWDLLTLVTYPRKDGHLPKAVGLDASTIVSATFKARAKKKK